MRERVDGRQGGTRDIAKFHAFFHINIVSNLAKERKKNYNFLRARGKKVAKLHNSVCSELRSIACFPLAFTYNCHFFFTRVNVWEMFCVGGIIVWLHVSVVLLAVKWIPFPSQHDSIFNISFVLQYNLPVCICEISLCV